MRNSMIVKKIISYISITLLTFNLFFMTTTFGFAGNQEVRYFSIFLLLANVFVISKLRLTNKDLIITIFLVIYAILFRQSVAGNILILYYTSIGLKDIDSRDFKTFLILLLLAINTLWGIAYLAIGFKDVIVISMGRVRHYLGFYNINQSALFYFPLFLLLLNRFKSIYLKIAVVIISLWIYNLTDTRSSFYALIIYLLLEFIPISRNRIVRKMLIVLIFLISLLFIFSRQIMTVFPILDEFLSFRLSIVASGISQMSLLQFVFGQNEILLDNSFIMFVSALGIIALIYLFILINQIVDYISDGDFNLIYAFLCYGLLESTLFLPEAIVAILFFTILEKGYMNMRSNLDA
uniref:hypothetical protein n=2 Tax=Streptococcus pluranimalium TaxID=82348 RepID=UPI003F6916D5